MKAFDRESLESQTAGLAKWSVVLIAAALMTVGLPEEGTAGGKIHASLEARLRTANPEELVPVTIVIDSTARADGIKSTARGRAPGRPSPDERRRAVAHLKALAAERRRCLPEWLAGDGKGSAAEDVRTFWIVDAVTADLPASTIEALRNHPDVRSVYLREAREVLCADERAAAETDEASPVWSVTKVGADTVWALYGIDGAGVRIAMLDTGVDYTHSDLQGRMWTHPGEIPGNAVDDDGNGYVDDYYGYDFALRASDPMDDEGHGTHTAGSAAGDGAAGLATGVAPGASIMALKVLDRGQGEEEDVWEAIQYAVENGCDIINMSLGWIQCCHHPTRALWRQACENAVAAGVVVVAACGNERDDEGTILYCAPPEQIRTPADVPDVIAVGALSAGDWVSDFSSEGPVTWEAVEGFGDHPYPPGLIKPDFSAPGQSINSTVLGGGYSGPTWAGTSMAAPHVSGTIALMLQADPTLTVGQVKSFLEQTCRDSGYPGKDNLFGHGRIHALSAVEAVLEARATSVTGGPGPQSARTNLVCRPNPFNPRIQLGFGLAAPQAVRLAVYDVEGRLVRIVSDTILPAGEHELHWDGLGETGAPAASGVYFCRFESEEGVVSRKIILAR